MSKKANTIYLHVSAPLLVLLNAEAHANGMPLSKFLEGLLKERYQTARELSANTPGCVAGQVHEEKEEAGV